MPKRIFDLVFSTVALVLLCPVFLFIALAIRWDSSGPVLFRQERVGRLGRPFHIRKFRTMVVDAPSRGPAITIGQDPRITRVGAWLRRTKLDELPQLMDVLQGHMSLVGPRPDVPAQRALPMPSHKTTMWWMQKSKKLKKANPFATAGFPQPRRAS